MDFLTLLFLVVAVIIFFRLRSVLGTRTGHERPPQEAVLKRVEKPVEGKNTQARPVPSAAAESARDRLEGVETDAPTAANLQRIADNDSSFRISHFMKGAKAAYELIVTSFARGDRNALRKLLGAEIFENFEDEIAAREKRGEKVDLHFIGIDRAEIRGASLQGDVAQIEVYFVSKLVQATRDKNGGVIEGDAVATSEVADLWTFEKSVKARDPNWKLVAAEDA